MEQRNPSRMIRRIPLVFGILVSVGALVGVGFHLSPVGQMFFWLVVGLHAILACFVFGVMITFQQDRRNAVYRGGSLNEYVVLSLIFDSGLIAEMWLKVPWQSANIAVVALASLTLALAIVVYVLS